MIKFSFNNDYNELDKYKKDLKKILKIIFKKLEIKQKYFFELSIIDENTIKIINKTYRNKNKETDVISFAFNDNGKNITKLLGEIFICYEKIIKQANEYNHSVRRELSFLFTHGVLHLLGYDHINKKDELKMFKLQDEILYEANILREI